ncbi:MAG: hypothetical protein KBA31_04705 [Alphaproteobacteria bacterium]|nr:hypothetical protein [Alphaproteobacteria bacterium]
MTPAIMGLTLAGMSQVSLRLRPSVAHHIARFLGVIVLVAWLATNGIGSGGAVA